MQNHPVKYKQVKQFFIFFLLILFALFIFLGGVLNNIVNKKSSPSLFIKKESKALRGSIITADGFHLAKSQKLYKAVINTYYLDPNKKDLFVALFSIYSNIPKEQIYKRLKNKKGSVVLSYNIPQKEAKYLKELSYELRRLKVFKSLKNPKTGIYMMQGLSILESGEKREYPYKTALTPLIGYPHKVEVDGYTLSKGVKGLEKRFEMELEPKQDGVLLGQRDVNGYILLNKESFVKDPINGLDIILTINLSLQIRIEHILDKAKEALDATEVYAAVMDAKSGAVLTLASSNRYLPKKIKRKDYPSLNTSAIEFSFEPGSVLKPITFALLLQKKLVNPFEIINAHNGRFRIGRKLITDEHKMKWISAEDVITYSSNVGIAQLAQRLDGFYFHKGLLAFGLSKKSTPDLIYEKVGSIPSPYKLNHEIYKATTSYGYGLRVNLMQLIKAYSIFDNEGKKTTPYFVKAFRDQNGKILEIEHEESPQILSSAVAERMKKILIKVVQKGTGKKAQTLGIVVGGKTGTAHIVQKGKYVREYNTSFVGFANDAKHHYIIGVVVRKPQKSHFAAQTAVPVFKKIVDTMIEESFLKPNIIK